MKNLKSLFIAFITGFVVGSLIMWLFLNLPKANALEAVTSWGKCEQLPNAQCGDTQGIQYQYQSRNSELVCPDGFGLNPGHDNCRKVDVNGHYIYADKVVDVAGHWGDTQSNQCPGGNPSTTCEQWNSGGWHHHHWVDETLKCPNGYEPNTSGVGAGINCRKWIDTTYLYANKVQGDWSDCPIGWEVYNESQCRISQSCTLKKPVSENCGNKTVTVQSSCSGTETVTIYGGDTRRTWRVNNEEKWVEFGATVVWENVPANSLVEWKHNDNWQTADEAYISRFTAENCVCQDLGWGLCGSPGVWSPPEYKPPVCTVSLPTKANVWSVNHISPTEVEVKWTSDDTNLTHFGLTFGYEETNLPMGVPFLPKEARSYTIGNLPANAKVYVEVWSFNTGECAVFSGRVLDN